MEKLLNRIHELYVEGIRDALNSQPTQPTLYAAYIGYYRWDAFPEDYAVLGRELHLLTTSYRDEMAAKYNDLNTLSAHLYGWSEIVGEKCAKIESSELQHLLLEWYTYQQTLEECDEVLAMIGAPITKACHTLNTEGWHGHAFTDDFVVFADCIPYMSTYGLKDSVPTGWLQRKQQEGMLQWATWKPS